MGIFVWSLANRYFTNLFAWEKKSTWRNLNIFSENLEGWQRKKADEDEKRLGNIGFLPFLAKWPHLGVAEASSPMGSTCNYRHLSHPHSDACTASSEKRKVQSHQVKEMALSPNLASSWKSPNPSLYWVLILPLANLSPRIVFHSLPGRSFISLQGQEQPKDRAWGSPSSFGRYWLC